MPRRPRALDFIEQSYRILSRKADSYAIRLKATDRLAVMHKILEIKLADQSKQSGHSPDVEPESPDLDKIAEAMVKKFKEGANELSQS